MKIKETYQYRFIEVIFGKGEIQNRRKASLELIFQLKRYGEENRMIHIVLYFELFSER